MHRPYASREATRTLRPSWASLPHPPGTLPSTKRCLNSLQHIHTRLSKDENCAATTLFAYADTAAVGVYLGGLINTAATAKTAFSAYIDHIKAQDRATSIGGIAQVCSANVSSDYIFGVVVGSTNNLASAQKAVRS